MDWFPATLLKNGGRHQEEKKSTVKKAAMELAKPCLCGAFNPHRAAKLLKR